MKRTKKAIPSLGQQLISGLESIIDAIRSGEPLEKRLRVRTVKLVPQTQDERPGDMKAERAEPGEGTDVDSP